MRVLCSRKRGLVDGEYNARVPVDLESMEKPDSIKDIFW